jgi:hypothetical protein
MSNSGNKKYAMKHYMIAASSGCFKSMNILIMSFEQGIIVCRDEIDSTLTAYNKSCVEMRSEGNNFVLWGCLSGVYQAWYTFYAETL